MNQPNMKPVPYYRLLQLLGDLVGGLRPRRYVRKELRRAQFRPTTRRIEHPIKIPAEIKRKLRRAKLLADARWDLGQWVEVMPPC